MKSPHLWLATALIVSGLCSHAQAREVPAGMASLLHAQSQDDVLSAPVEHPRWFRPVRDMKTVFRAQSEDGAPVPPDATVTPNTAAPNTIDVPPADSTIVSPGVTGDTMLGLPEPTTWNAFSPPVTSDPFLNGGVVQPYAPGAPVAPGYGAPAYGAPGMGGPMMGPGGAGGFSTYGANGGRPWRYGWEQRLDLHLIPSADLSGAGMSGSYEEFGVDYDLALTRPFMPGWILRETGQFRSRSFDGPTIGAGLPGSVFHLGLDFEFATPQAGPYSVALGVTPSINTDFNNSASSIAWQFDGRGIVWWHLNPGWMFGLGAMYWDRVDDRVIPWAGWVYRDDFWEVRLMAPESEIRLFIGNEPWWAKWIYFRARYNVESYEISTVAGTRDEVEFEDWQLTLGFQMDAGCYRWFIEGGIILDRELNYGSNPNLTADTSYITRIGWRY